VMDIFCFVLSAFTSTLFLDCAGNRQGSVAMHAIVMMCFIWNIKKF
jgi:hypothetical protein